MQAPSETWAQSDLLCQQIANSFKVVFSSFAKRSRLAETKHIELASASSPRLANASPQRSVGAKRPVMPTRLQLVSILFQSTLLSFAPCEENLYYNILPCRSRPAGKKSRALARALASFPRFVNAFLAIVCALCYVKLSAHTKRVLRAVYSFVPIHLF